MEFKVREVTNEPQKGVVELEEELIKEATEANEEQVEVESAEPELTEEQILSYISKRYNKNISSFDELVQERQSNGELPEDVASFLKYKNETGRGMQDYLKLQRDYDEMDPDAMLREYFKATEEGLDDDDIDAMLDEFRFDEDLDSESDIKKAKIAKKKAVMKAKTYFNEQKEKYKQPLESRTGAIPESEKEEYEAYKQYINQAKSLEEEHERKRKWFQQKTDELFSGTFKGFEFDVNGKKVLFSPGATSEIKNAQSTPANFINRFLDENGMMKDAVGYHKSLAVAMNPEKFAKFFYEQGVADATEDVTKKIKNINMSERKAPEVANTGGVQIRAVNPDTGSSLKIKSFKK